MDYMISGGAGGCGEETTHDRIRTAAGAKERIETLLAPKPASGINQFVAPWPGEEQHLLCGGFGCTAERSVNLYRAPSSNFYDCRHLSMTSVTAECVSLVIMLSCR